VSIVNIVEVDIVEFLTITNILGIYVAWFPVLQELGSCE